MSTELDQEAVDSAAQWLADAPDVATATARLAHVRDLAITEEQIDDRQADLFVGRVRDRAQQLRDSRAAAALGTRPQPILESPVRRRAVIYDPKRPGYEVPDEEPARQLARDHARATGSPLFASAESRPARPVGAHLAAQIGAPPSAPKRGRK